MPAAAVWLLAVVVVASAALLPPPMSGSGTPDGRLAASKVDTVEEVRGRSVLPRLPSLLPGKDRQKSTDGQRLSPPTLSSVPDVPRAAVPARSLSVVATEACSAEAVAAVCELERGQAGLRAALPAHAALAAQCAHRWVRPTAMLGAGMTGRVDAGITVCGTPLVIKSAVVAPGAAPGLDRGEGAVARDCSFLSHLAPAAAGCPACLPRFYGADRGRCYSEWIHPATSLLHFLRQDVFGGGRRAQQLFPSSAHRLNAVKAVISQGLQLLAVLAQAGVVHRDLLPLNLVVRHPREPFFHLVAFDFCQAVWVGTPGGEPGGEHADTAAGAPPGLPTADGASLTRWGGPLAAWDAFSLACSLVDALYVPTPRLASHGWRMRPQCFVGLPGVNSTMPRHAHRAMAVEWTSSLTPRDLEWVLLRMVQWPPPSRMTQLSEIAAALDRVDRMREDLVSRL
jgi:hypothetical protein